MRCRAFWYESSSCFDFCPAKHGRGRNRLKSRFCKPSFKRGNRSSVWMFFQCTKSLSSAAGHSEFLPAWSFHKFRLNPSNFDVPLTWDQRSIDFTSCEFHGLNCHFHSRHLGHHSLHGTHRAAGMCSNTIKYLSLSLSFFHSQRSGLLIDRNVTKASPFVVIQHLKTRNCSNRNIHYHNSLQTHEWI